MSAAGGEGWVDVIADDVAGGGDCAAAGVAFDDDDFGAGDLAGVFHAGEDLVSGDIACDADAEDVAEADVEDEFGGGAGVDAAEDDGEGVLGVCGAVDLADEVAVEALACDEALVAFFEHADDVCRGGVALDVAGGDVDVLDLVGDGVAVFEADGADVDAAFGGLIVSEVLDHAEDIGVDVVGGACVEDDVVAWFEAGEGGGEGGAVEESDLASEFDACDWAAGVGFADDVEAEAEVLLEDEGG